MKVPEKGDSAVNGANPGWGLGGFDLDGTLVRGTSVLLHVGMRLGKETAAKRLMEGYESYGLSNREVANEAASLFSGLTRTELYELVKDIPRLEDIRSSVALLHSMRIACVIASITFDFASEWFALTYGFDRFSGIALQFDSAGRATGEVSVHFDEHDKAALIREQCKALNISPARVFYVGDSRSDLPTFDMVGHSVALNGTPEANLAANASATGESLIDALLKVPGIGVLFDRSNSSLKERGRVKWGPDPMPFTTA